MQEEKRVNANNIYVLPANNKKTRKIQQKIAIVVNLYYIENIATYLSYLKEIDEYIHIYICSSNESVISLVKEEFELLQRENIFYLKKDNRGRDISALLVSFKPYVKQYDYLCFLHDKSAKHNFLKEDLNFWLMNLWGNMISSKEYIQDVLDMLQSGKYGLLLPPKPIGIYMDSWYADPWKVNYDNIIQLAKKIELELEIKKEDRDIVSLGSVFWCNTKALEKLLLYDWKYEDFPNEPMPDDGTISHAIERILGFVAVEAGYEVGTIMCTEYASQMMEIVQEKMEMTYEWLWKNIRVKNTYQLSNYDNEREKIGNLFEKEREVFLYGAGFYGERYLERLLFWGYEPKGFVVSNGKKTVSKFCDYPVYELQEIGSIDDCGIIITTNPDLQEEIGNYLENNGFYNYVKAIVV